MGHNDRRRWRSVGDGYERAASQGRTWRVRPVGGGWRLERIDPGARGWLGGPAEATAHALWDAPTPEACRDMVVGIDRHEALERRFAKTSFEAVRPSPIPGITLKGERKGCNVVVRAVRDDAGPEGEAIGYYRADLSGWLPTWILGEPTFNGGSSVDRPHIGKGLGRALYDLAEEMAGVPLTPHGRFGTTGGRTALSTAFWDKRARHRRVLGVGDPEVAARDAERERVRGILNLASSRRYARDPYLIAAVAAATGWDVAYVRSPDGDGIEEAWCLGPDGGALSGGGPDMGLPSTTHPDAALVPEVLRADAGGFLGLVEGQPWHGPNAGDPAGAHREQVAGAAKGAALVLGRYAGIAVDPDALARAILEPEANAVTPAA